MASPPVTPFVDAMRVFLAFLAPCAKPVANPVSQITFQTKENLHDVYEGLGDLCNMTKLVNGETVVLIKVTDDLIGF